MQLTSSGENMITSRKVLAVFVASVLVSLIIGTESNCSAMAVDECIQAIAAFNRKEYRQCVILLDKVLARNPRDARAWYYRALAYAESGAVKEAKQAYEDVINHCPETEECALAKKGLKELNIYETSAEHTSGASKASERQKEKSGTESSATKQVSGVSSEDAGAKPSSPEDRLPEEASFPFYMNSADRTIVSASINGTPVSMYLDTGSDRVVVPQNLAEASGVHLGDLHEPVGEYKRTGQKIWKINADIQVGDIRRQNLPIYVFEPGPWPSAILLGNDFFAGYTVEQNQNGKIICRKSASDRTTDPETKSKLTEARVSYRGGYLIPFKMSRGRQAVISCKINGRDADVLFDSGATPGVFMTWQQAKKLGVNLDGAYAIRGGIGSTYIPYSRAYFDIEISTFRALGVRGMVTDEKDATWGTDYPLIGPDVFESQGYSWKLDRVHNVIDLERKS